ncbi:GSCOCG00007054001-RA-CDS, partial [Cotesia congregata]
GHFLPTNDHQLSVFFNGLLERTIKRIVVLLPMIQKCIYLFTEQFNRAG